MMCEEATCCEHKHLEIFLFKCETQTSRIFETRLKINQENSVFYLFKENLIFRN